MKSVIECRDCLTHVVSSVTTADIRDLQSPLILLGVGDTYPVVLGDDDLVVGEDSLGADPDPGHLVGLTDGDVTDQAGHPAHPHSGVGGGRQEPGLH